MSLAVALALSARASAAQEVPFAYAELSADGRIERGVEGGYRDGALFEAGSITKFACTLATLRLHDRGTLDIDATLGALLPAFADTPIAPVTLRQVLQSRSGLADGLIPAFQSDPETVFATPDAVAAIRAFAAGELAFAPGSEWSYDLVNWIVVQAVIEAKTGRPVGDVVENLVLRPAGMGSSRIFTGTIGADAQAPVEESTPIPAFLTCAGGLATTPTDLIALARFPHWGGLSAGSLAALTTVTTPEEGYTLGGRYADPVGQGGKWISWQSGSNGAYKSLVTYDPASDTGFAAMTAADDTATLDTAREAWLEAP